MHIGKPYSLQQTEVCELTRMALAPHKATTSRVLSLAVKMAAQHAKGMRLIVSYADPHAGHCGTIYQATNWVFVGTQAPCPYYRAPDGKLWHGRMVSKDGTKRVYGKRRNVWRFDQCEKIMMPGKHKYLYPLDKAMRKQIEQLSKPYPKRAGSVRGDTPADQAGEGGSSPTPALHPDKQ